MALSHIARLVIQIPNLKVEDGGYFHQPSPCPNYFSLYSIPRVNNLRDEQEREVLDDLRSTTFEIQRKAYQQCFCSILF